MKERTKGLWKAILGTAVAFTLVFSVVSPAVADTTAGSGGGSGGQSGSSSWYWAYGDRPGDAWNSFVSDWGSGVRAANGTVYSSRGGSTGANLSICQNAAQIWWIHFNKTGYTKFWGLDPEYLIDGRTPSSWVGDLGLTGAQREARGTVPAGTTLSNGYTTTSNAYFSDLVKSQAATFVSNNTANNSTIVLVCSELSPAKVVDESGSQSRTVTNGGTYNAPSSFTTVVQRQVLNTTSNTATDNGVDLIGVNNLHDQAAAPVITNYGQIVSAVVGGTLFGSTPVNNLTRAQWNQIETLINNAKTQDATLNHGVVDLDTANRQGLAEGGVLNVSEWAQRATISTSGSQTYTDNWRYTGVRYWNGSDWGPVQNINWIDTRLTTTPVWNNGNGWALSSEHYSVTSSTPTQENTAFWQILSVHCNLNQLNALKTALTAAGRGATVIEQTNHDDGTITAILRTRVSNQGWADVPVGNAAQQQAVNNAQAAVTAAQTAHTQAVNAYNAAVAARNTAQTNYNNAQAAYNTRLSAQGNVYPALVDANDNLTTAQTNYDKARTAALTSSASLRQYVAGLTPGDNTAYTSTTVPYTGAANSNPVVDSAGNFYIRGTNGITKITPSGATSLIPVASSGGVGAGMAIDNQNRIYFLNVQGNLQRVTQAGVITTIANLGISGTGMAVDANYNVYLAQNSTNTVRKITQAGVVSVISTTISYPWGVAVTTAGDVYVASYDTNAVYRIPAAGGAPQLAASLAYPMGVHSNGNDVYISAWSTGNIYKLAGGTTLSPVMANSTTAVSAGAASYGFAVAPDQTIYTMSTPSANSYKKFTPVNGIPAQDQTALVAALSTYESFYATGYDPNPSTQSTNAVTRANNARAGALNQTLVTRVDDFLAKNSALAAAWTPYNNAVNAQATAQTNFNNSQTGLAAYLTAMNNAANALEDANDAVDDASDLVATRAAAITAAQNNLASAQQALAASSGVTQRVWSPARPTYLDFGDARNPSASLAASGYVGFYDKECVTDCTTSSTGTNATATNGANGNASNSSNLGNKDSLGGVVLRDSTAREQGNTSPNTNSNYLEIFRDNSTARTVRVNTAYPVVTGTNFNYNGSAPFTTTVNIWGMSTPDTNPASGQFFMTAVNITNRAGGGTSEVLFDGMNGTNVWTTDLTRAPGTQKNFGNDLYSTGASETFSGFANTFQVGATWASEKDRPVVLNIKWEYRPTTVVTIPSQIGFGAPLSGTDSSSQFRIAQTQDLNQALDVRCYAQYGVTDSLDNNLGNLTQQYTGTGTTNNIDTGLITTANGDDSYLENNNLVLKFIRGVAE